MRLIDADALIEKWYEVNDIGPEDRGAIFIGYTEIPRFINNAPTVQPTGDLTSREDAVNEIHKYFVEEINKTPYTKDAEFTDLPDIPRYYYEKVVGNMAHEINMLKEQLESAEAEQGEWKIDEYGIYHCPFCHAINNTVYKSFCPNCGARMEANE